MAREPAYPLARRLAAEALGSALLLVAIVGPAVSARQLAGATPLLTLLSNAFATCAMLYVLIVWLAPVSGAHLNPAISLAALARRELGRREAAGYVAAQALGAVSGVAVAHTLFEAELFSMASQARTGAAQWASEALFTFTLVAAVLGCTERQVAVLAAVVAAVVAWGFIATPTGFGNPAVALARAFTDSPAGIRWQDVPGFVAAELLGAAAAVALRARTRERFSARTAGPSPT